MKALLASALFAGALLLGTGVASADAAANYAKHCASCHGKDGKGQTKMGKKAGAKDYTDKKVQAAFTDAQALDAIKNGITRDGKQVKKGFAAKLSEAEMKDLVQYVRAFAK